MTIAPHLLRPAVANALWRGLQAKAWRADYASNSDRPLPPAEIKTTTPAPESPEPRWESVNGRLYAYARRSDSRINVAFTATLLREDHDGLLKLLQWEARRAYTDALELAQCERPFYRDPKSPTGWYRNHKDGAVSDTAARVLLLLAGLAIVDVITPEIEAALIGDLTTSEAKASQ